MPHNVIVVGMPRSGTSMLTGIFGRKGFFLTEDEETELRVPDTGNPDGYWEAAGLIQRNVEVFSAVGFPHHNTWLFDALTTEQADRIRSLPPLPGHREFVQSYEMKRPWVWKDPRLCYTLAYWWPMVDPDTTRVLFIKRDAEATLRSFLRLRWREDTPEARADVMRRIADHNAAAECAIASLGIPSLTVSYDEFRTNCAHIAERLSEFVGFSLESGDLGFNQRYDHSAGRGRVTVVLERTSSRIPQPIKRLLRSLLPPSLLERLLPGVVSPGPERE